MKTNLDHNVTLSDGYSVTSLVMFFPLQWAIMVSDLSVLAADRHVILTPETEAHK